MAEKLLGSCDMEKLMPDTLRFFLARDFARRASELGEIAVVFMNQTTIQREDLPRLFVLTDTTDPEIRSLQRKVDWIRAEVCPNNFCLKTLGDIKVVGPEKLMFLRAVRSNLWQPAVCLADYSPDGSYRSMTRTLLNPGLN